MSRLAAFIVLGAAFSPTAVAAAPPQQCRFTHRPLAVGDEARETIRFAVDLKTVLVQNGQVVSMTDQALKRSEESVVVRLSPEAGQTAKARITYNASTQTTQTRGGDESIDDRPVARKTYIVARVSEDLVITDDEGAAPPEEERAIVARTLAGLGRPNLLAIFLNGRTLTVGETVRLPPEFSERMLSGWDESLAKLPLDVMLIGTERVDGALCALLHTPPAGASDAPTKRAPVDAKFLIELDTCRVALVELRGPIATSERRGAPGQEFDGRRKGKLQVAVHVEHHRAR
jgi:hypothetical protein